MEHTPFRPASFARVLKCFYLPLNVDSICLLCKPFDIWLAPIDLPVGGLISSTNDLLAWLRCWLQRGDGDDLEEEQKSGGVDDGLMQ